MSQAYDAGVAEGMEKVAFSVTREGHKFDTEMAKAREHAGAKEMELGQKYKGLAYRDPKSGKTKRGKMGRALRGFQAHPDILGGIRNPRHQAYLAKKHGKGKQGWNPLGGMLTPSKYEKGGTKGIKSEFGKFETGKDKDKK